MNPSSSSTSSSSPRAQAVFLALALTTVVGLDYARWAWGAEDSLPAATGPLSRFDPAVGYRFLPGLRERLLRLDHGRVVADFEVRTNQRGFFSRRELLPARQAARRWVVLGDSFTAASFLETPWVDRAQELLDARGLGDELELVSCAVNGANATNAQLILAALLDEGVEVDGVVLAGLRGGAYPFVWHFSEHGGHVGEVPWPLTAADFERHVRPRLPLAYALRSHAELDRVVAGGRPDMLPFALPVLRRALAKAEQTLSGATPWQPPVGDVATFEPLFALLADHDLALVVARIPRREDPSGAIHQPAALLDVARARGGAVFDATSTFAAPDAYTRSTWWFTHDGHWTQRGSDRYAEAFVDWVAARLR